MPTPIVLQRDGSRVEVVVEAGGRIAQIVADGEPLLTEPADDPTSMGWGSFPMAPWAGRIRHGRFRFLGVDQQLATNHQDIAPDGGHADPDRRHAIHGTVFARPWRVDEVSATSIAMSCDLTGALDWPFPGTARQRIAIGDRLVRCELEVEAGERAFPAEIGWHPWFRAPDRLEFAPLAMYRRDDLGLPTGELVVPPPGPWDDCFVTTAPAVLHYDRRAAPKVTVRSDCDHLVVFDRIAGATCVEPQSGPPDAVTIRPRLLPPGDRLRRTMSIGW